MPQLLIKNLLIQQKLRKKTDRLNNKIFFILNRKLKKKTRRLANKNILKLLKINKKK